MQTLCRFILKCFSWRIVGQLPDAKKYMVIVAPHTSNWDLVVALVARFAEGTKINFLAKHQLFFFPLGLVLRLFGGKPVNRLVKSNVVEQTVRLYNTEDSLKLAIAPEGTRSNVTRWKEGFYYIALQADIPIVMIGLDYASKEVRIAPSFKVSGDISTDFKKILEFFKTIKGRYPKKIPDYQPKKET
jgi:1-acyl-sn-glycerol-3-phosphate acyltransferase